MCDRSALPAFALHVERTDLEVEPSIRERRYGIPGTLSAYRLSKPIDFTRARENSRVIGRQSIYVRGDLCGEHWENGKGCDIGYALAVSSREEAKQRGRMHRHSP
jgi:hypothetical protein